MAINYGKGKNDSDYDLGYHPTRFTLQFASICDMFCRRKCQFQFSEQSGAQPILEPFRVLCNCQQ